MDKKFSYNYPRPALAADIICHYHGPNGEEFLLIERKHEPFAGHWAFPGGFVDKGENALEGAVRELSEEVSLVLPSYRFHELGAFTEPNRDPRGWVVSIAFSIALTDAEHRMVKAADDAANAQWFTLADLPPLAFDHAQMLDRLLAR